MQVCQIVSIETCQLTAVKLLNLSKINHVTEKSPSTTGQIVNTTRMVNVYCLKLQGARALDIVTTGPLHSPIPIK
jgi:ribosomal protein L30/L7E